MIELIFTPAAELGAAAVFFLSVLLVFVGMWRGRPSLQARRLQWLSKLELVVNPLDVQVFELHRVHSGHFEAHAYVGAEGAEGSHEVVFWTLDQGGVLRAKEALDRDQTFAWRIDISRILREESV